MVLDTLTEILTVNYSQDWNIVVEITSFDTQKNQQPTIARLELVNTGGIFTQSLEQQFAIVRLGFIEFGYFV